MFLPPVFAFIGGVGTWELLIVLGIILVLFGNRLPSVMRSMGRGIKEFKDGINDDTPDPEDSEKIAKSKGEKGAYEP